MILALPVLTLYDVLRKGYNLQGLDMESWMGLAHAAYVCVAIGALYGVVVAVRGKLAPLEQSVTKKVMVNTLCGTVFLAFALPLFLFLFKVDGYLSFLARFVWDFIVDSL